MSLYSQLFLPTNHSYALVAPYHPRFFYSPIIFFSLYLSLLFQKYLCHPHSWNNIFMLFPMPTEKYKRQYMSLSEMLIFLSSLPSSFLSFLPSLSFFPFCSLPSFFQNTQLLFIHCLSAWLCREFILELVLYFESIQIIYIWLKIC